MDIWNHITKKNRDQQKSSKLHGIKLHEITWGTGIWPIYLEIMARFSKCSSVSSPATFLGYCPWFHIVVRGMGRTYWIGGWCRTWIILSLILAVSTQDIRCLSTLVIHQTSSLNHHSHTSNTMRLQRRTGESTKGFEIRKRNQNVGNATMTGAVRKHRNFCRFWCSFGRSGWAKNRLSPQARQNPPGPFCSVSMFQLFGCFPSYNDPKPWFPPISKWNMP